MTIILNMFDWTLRRDDFNSFALEGLVGRDEDALNLVKSAPVKIII